MSEMVFVPKADITAAMVTLRDNGCCHAADVLQRSTRSAPSTDPHAQLNAAVVEAAKEWCATLVRSCLMSPQARATVCAVDALAAAQQQAADAALIQEIADMICQRPGALFEVLPHALARMREHDRAKS